MKIFVFEKEIRNFSISAILQTLIEFCQQICNFSDLLQVIICYEYLQFIESQLPFFPKGSDYNNIFKQDDRTIQGNSLYSLLCSLEYSHISCFLLSTEAFGRFSLSFRLSFHFIKKKKSNIPYLGVLFCFKNWLGFRKLTSRLEFCV